MRKKIIQIEKKFIKGNKKMLEIIEMIEKRAKEDPSNEVKAWNRLQNKFLSQEKIDKLLFKFVEETKNFNIKRLKGELNKIKGKYKQYNFNFYRFEQPTPFFKIYKNRKIVSLLIPGHRNPLMDIYYKKELPDKLIKLLKNTYEKNGFICITLSERKELKKNKSYNQLFHGGACQTVLNSKRDPFYQMGVYGEDEVVFLNKDPKLKKFIEKQKRAMKNESEKPK